MNRPRRWAAALWTFAVTLVLAVVLGAPFTGDRLSSHGNSLLAQLITGLRFPQWTYRPAHGAPHAVAAWLAPMIADLVLALLAGAIAALATTTAASSARARLAGLLAGWGLSTVAAAIAGAGRVLALSTVTHPGTALSGQISDAVSAGLWFGLATGWVAGIVLAAAVRKVVAVETAGQPSMAGAPAGAAAEEVEAIRIWSPSDAAADWQRTQDMPVGASQAGQPWPAADNPGGAPTAPAG
jgi:hypothetical protein